MDLIQKFQIQVTILVAIPKILNNLFSKSNKTISSNYDDETTEFQSDKENSFGNFKISDSQFGNWSNELSFISKRLEKTIESSEDDFLAVGQSLFSMNQGVSMVTKKTMEMLDLISGESTETVLTRITSTMDNISSSLEEVSATVQNDMSVMMKISSSISKVHEFELSFKKVVKNLQICSKATRIESSRLLHLNEDFSSLAHNVDDLSVIIHEKFTNFFRRLKTLQALIDRTVSAITESEAKHLKLTQDSINNALMNLVALTGKQTEAFLMINEINSKSKNISKNMSAIVMNLQSQDATRQIVEHIITAISRLHNEMEELKQQESVEPAQRSDMLIETLAISKLQKAQMDKARHDFVGAVQTILSGLTDINVNIDDLRKNVSGLAGQSDFTDTTLFSSIEQDINKLISTLVKNSGNREKLIKSIINVASDIAEFSSFINDIEEIGANIELIAMNARIKAARVGSEGSALAVISEQIQKNSLETQKHTQVLLDMLKEAARVSESLSDHRELATQSIENDPKQMMLDLEGQLKIFGNIQNRVATLNKETILECEMVSNKIRGLVGGVTVHKVFDRRVEQLSYQLQRLVRSVEINASNFSLQRVKDRLKELENNYTMESERVIHSMVMNDTKIPVASVAVDTGSEVDFFDSFSETSSPTESTNSTFEDFSLTENSGSDDVLFEDFSSPIQAEAVDEPVLFEDFSSPAEEVDDNSNVDFFDTSEEIPKVNQSKTQQSNESVEFFEEFPPTENTPESKNTTDDEDLGDNVDLF